MRTLDTTKFPSAVCQAIKLEISSWLEPHKKCKLTNVIVQFPDAVKHLYGQQENIGWDHFFRLLINLMEQVQIIHLTFNCGEAKL